MYIYIYVYIHIYVYIYIDLYTYLEIYIYMYMYSPNPEPRRPRERSFDRARTLLGLLLQGTRSWHPEPRNPGDISRPTLLRSRSASLGLTHLPLNPEPRILGMWQGLQEGRCKATWKRECKLPWRKAGLLKPSWWFSGFGPDGCQ